MHVLQAPTSAAAALFAKTAQEYPLEQGNHGTTTSNVFIKRWTFTSESGFGDLCKMADHNGGCHVIEDRQSKAQPQDNSSAPQWLNGQCVLSMQSGSILNPSFDLDLCRAKLERDGFQIPVTDLEAPLKMALDVASVKRYIIFNSSMFHLLMAPVLYIVLWCAIFSSIHIYITVSDYWVLCLCVSLMAIFLTTAIIFVLHQSKKKINMNLDVRLISVNERLVKHKLLVAVDDWVQNCTGHLQLFFVYWDMARCLKALTVAFEERNSEAQDAQKKLQKRMSHLVLVSELPEVDTEPGASHTDTTTEGPSVEQDTEEHRPLLQNQDPAHGTSSVQRGAHQVTTSFSLVPDPALPAQVLQNFNSFKNNTNI